MSLKLNFGLHLGFAITRYPEPKEWARLVSEEFGISHVQFVSDLLQPSLPDVLIEKEIDKLRNACDKYGLIIDHTFTSPRWNFFGHPNEKMREYWLAWFKRFVDISAKLGAMSTGSLLGIYSVRDIAARREFIFDEIVKNWHALAAYSKKRGLRFLTWEPMSVPREMGETIGEARRIMNALNAEKKPEIPILICLDIDHGDVSSPEPADLDPYAWITAFGREIPTLHIKQRTKNLFGHKPFTPENNKEGIIFPDRIISTLRDAGAEEVTLYLELSFRERHPYEHNVIKEIKTSVDYWLPFIEKYSNQ